MGVLSVSTKGSTKTASQPDEVKSPFDLQVKPMETASPPEVSVPPARGDAATVSTADIPILVLGGVVTTETESSPETGEGFSTEESSTEESVMEGSAIEASTIEVSPIVPPSVLVQNYRNDSTVGATAPLQPPATGRPVSPESLSKRGQALSLGKGTAVGTSPASAGSGGFRESGRDGGKSQNNLWMRLPTDVKAAVLRAVEASDFQVSLEGTQKLICSLR